MLRCPSCGRRLLDREGICALHGRPPNGESENCVANDDTAPAELDQRYRIEGILGRGGFGIVYAGQAPDGSDVAIKVLYRDSEMGLRRFLHEVEALQAIGAPHV